MGLFKDINKVVKVGTTKVGGQEKKLKKKEEKITKFIEDIYKLDDEVDKLLGEYPFDIENVYAIEYKRDDLGQVDLVAYFHDRYYIDTKVICDNLGLEKKRKVAIALSQIYPILGWIEDDFPSQEAIYAEARKRILENCQPLYYSEIRKKKLEDCMKFWFGEIDKYNYEICYAKELNYNEKRSRVLKDYKFAKEFLDNKHEQEEKEAQAKREQEEKEAQAKREQEEKEAQAKREQEWKEVQAKCEQEWKEVQAKREQERQEAQAKREQEQKQAIEEAGKRGEAVTNYALKWLDRNMFYQINQEENSSVKLFNKEFMDEVQEYDHILVGKAGVILIETKNYSGTLEIDENGNWIRTKSSDDVHGIVNPLQQVRRHEKLLKSFLSEDVPIISYICIANDKCVLKGIENSKVPVVKSDQIVEFIETHNNESILSEEQIQDIISSIKEHMVESN